MIFQIALLYFTGMGCISQQRIKRSEARTNLATEYLKEGNPTDAYDEDAARRGRRTREPNSDICTQVSEKDESSG